MSSHLEPEEIELVNQYFTAKCCGARLPSDYLEYYLFWPEERRPAWLTHQWCSKCVQARLGEDNPKYADSGLLPETYVIWELAKEKGIDLGPRLRDIELHKLIRRVAYRYEYPELIEWLNCDWSPDELWNWQQLFEHFSEAKKWRVCGFQASEDNMDAIRAWVEWGCGPQKARKFAGEGVVSPPEIEYREHGLSIEDAVRFQRGGFGFWLDGPSSVESWIDVDLAWDDVCLLRAELDANRQTIEDLHSTVESRAVNLDDGEEDICWQFLGVMFARLKRAGLALTFQNLEMFWGLTSREILRAIDSPRDTREAVEMLRQDIPLSRAAFYERALQCGVDRDTAKFLTQRGMTLKELGQVEAGEAISKVLKGMEEMLRGDSGLSTSTALSWCTQGNFTFNISDWIALGLSPAKAKLWDEIRISPQEARKWIAAGIKSPEIARRRRDSGIRP